MTSNLLVVRSIVSRVLWGGAILGAIYGAIDLVFGLNVATGAPQQAAGAAISCATALLPYVVARGFDEITRPHLK